MSNTRSRLSDRRVVNGLAATHPSAGQASARRRSVRATKRPHSGIASADGGSAEHSERMPQKVRRWAPLERPSPIKSRSLAKGGLDE
jgi:hypothetical protein